jgi:hypothetical protein
MKIAEYGSESGFISHRHESSDPNPDQDLDPHKNVMDPQHCQYGTIKLRPPISSIYLDHHSAMQNLYNTGTR